MIHEFGGNTVSRVYENGLAWFNRAGTNEQSRNGPVLTLPGPAVFTLYNPQARVLIDPIRDANPFFHMMEFIWMMAGRNDSAWISHFNKRMETYANEGRLNSAYGHRWRKEYGIDQIRITIDKLRADSRTRQAVISMWDPYLDNRDGMRDRACNTTIYFRNVDGRLNCLVCNRSNDYLWGALGANICHLTMLHELVAWFSELPLGAYSVISMNMHIYTDNPKYTQILNTLISPDVYKTVAPQSMFTTEDTYADFVSDCENFCSNSINDPPYEMVTPWMNDTALPALQAWRTRKRGKPGTEVTLIKQDDWRIACQMWLDRHVISSSATSTEP